MKRTVLVVDDDPPICELVKIVLEPRGYEVEIAHSGREAIEKVAHSRPDIVVLDVMMPEMHGFDVCRAIKQTEASRDVKIIMLSAKGLDVDKEAAAHAGADAYLVKPVGLSDLLDTVIRLLREENA
jgi:DNA-binding response OmpR family regulator